MLCTKAIYSTPELSYVLGYHTYSLVSHLFEIERLATEKAS
jgi:hypothetical protein